MATWLQRMADGLAGMPERKSIDRRVLERHAERKASSTMRAILASANPSARWNTTDYVSVAREGFSRNPYVYSAITQISRAFAGIKWKVYTDSTKSTELVNHPLKTLLDRPNPREGHSRFFENIMAYRNLDGNIFLQAAGPLSGPPNELYVLRPDRVSIITGTYNDPIAGYVYTVGNSKVPLPYETVRHIKTFNPLDDWRGLSPMSAAAMSVDQSNASKAWNVSLLQNGARPPGAMSTDATLDPEAYTRLKESIQEEYAGFMNAGRPLLLEGGVTWQEMGISPADMDWLEGQKLSAREIAIVHNIAPELIGDSANKTYSNYGEARVALYQENVLPSSDEIRDELNAWLSPMYSDNPYCDYDKEDIEALQEDRDSLWTRADNAFKSGWITINVAHKMVGLEEDTEKGDQYTWETKPVPAPAPVPALGPGGVTITEDGKPKVPQLGPGDNSPDGLDGEDEPGSKRVLPFARGPWITRQQQAR